MGVSNPGALTITKDTLLVKFGGTTCTYDSLNTDTLSAITCTLEGGVIAGSYIPILHIKDKGYVKNDGESLTASEIGLQITSIDKTTIGKNGGDEVVITGKHFSRTLVDGL